MICMLMEVDWGGKLIANSLDYWGDHETHPNGHKISEVDWGGHDCSSNHMNDFLFSEVDWGAHDSSFFLFLVNIDYDAKPMDFFTQGLGGELQQIMSPLLSLDTWLIHWILAKLKMMLSTPNQLILNWMTLNNLLASPSSPSSPW